MSIESMIEFNRFTNLAVIWMNMNEYNWIQLNMDEFEFNSNEWNYLSPGSLGDGSRELQVELLSERDGLFALELLLLRLVHG